MSIPVPVLPKNLGSQPVKPGCMAKLGLGKQVVGKIVKPSDGKQPEKSPSQGAETVFSEHLTMVQTGNQVVKKVKGTQKSVVSKPLTPHTASKSIKPIKSGKNQPHIGKTTIPIGKTLSTGVTSKAGLKTGPAVVANGFIPKQIRTHQSKQSKVDHNLPVEHQTSARPQGEAFKVATPKVLKDNKTLIRSSIIPEKSPQEIAKTIEISSKNQVHDFRLDPTLTHPKYTDQPVQTGEDPRKIMAGKQIRNQHIQSAESGDKHNPIGEMKSGKQSSDLFQFTKVGKHQDSPEVIQKDRPMPTTQNIPQEKANYPEHIEERPIPKPQPEPFAPVASKSNSYSQVRQSKVESPSVVEKQVEKAHTEHKATPQNREVFPQKALNHATAKEGKPTTSINPHRFVFSLSKTIGTGDLVQSIKTPERVHDASKVSISHSQAKVKSAVATKGDESVLQSDVRQGSDAVKDIGIIDSKTGTSVRSIPHQETPSVPKIDFWVQTLTRHVQEESTVRQMAMIQKITQWVEIFADTKQKKPSHLTIQDQRMGNLEFEYSEKLDGKQITISVENESVRNHLQKILPVVQESLNHRGQAQVGIFVQLKQESDMRQELYQDGRSSQHYRNPVDHDKQSDTSTSSSLNTVMMKHYGYNTIDMVA